MYIKSTYILYIQYSILHIAQIILTTHTAHLTQAILIYKLKVDLTYIIFYTDSVCFNIQHMGK